MANFKTLLDHLNELPVNKNLFWLAADLSH
jgi:hypothetical protein